MKAKQIPRIDIHDRVVLPQVRHPETGCPEDLDEFVEEILDEM